LTSEQERGKVLASQRREATTMQALSHNGFSVDLQSSDALDYLRNEHPLAALQVLAGFPEWFRVEWEGSWFDTEAMGVDPEWGCWLADAIEATGLVYWEEGEPWAV
jgi:hypothetical protein